MALGLEENDFVCFAKVYYHTVPLCLAQSCTLVNSAATLISEFSGTKRVELSANLMSSLLLDTYLNLETKQDIM